ncbi:MAG: T9SS type A sorting domain-containing protein, partial [candidate division WOR-3 bacterium]
NKVGDFYRYDPAGDSWQTLALWKGGIENKGPAKGSVGVADGHGRVYAVKGNNTLGFWCYFSDGDSWHQLPDVPLGITRKKVKGGSDLVYLEENGLPYVYLLKGYKNEFFRFNIAADSWERLAEAPEGVYPKWDKGSWLVYDGLRYIYAHKAKVHEFWRFDCWSASWDTHQLKGMPFLSRTGKTKRSKDGSSGAWNEGFIYALKGGNTCEFYKYDVAGDSWTELDTMPSVGSTGKKKRVKAGGDLVAAGPGLFYALKGNKTREFWYYYEPKVDAPLWWDNGGVAALASSTRWLALAPNPAKERVQLEFGTAVTQSARVRVYDISGALVIERRFAGGELGTRSLELKGLAEGVYLVRMEGSGLAAVQKLVIQR